MAKKCEKAFVNGTLMFGPRGGEYILVKSRNKGKMYKKYCKFKENNKQKLINDVMKGYRPR